MRKYFEEIEKFLFNVFLPISVEMFKLKENKVTKEKTISNVIIPILNDYINEVKKEFKDKYNIELTDEDVINQIKLVLMNRRKNVNFKNKSS